MQPWSSELLLAFPPSRDGTQDTWSGGGQQGVSVKGGGCRHRRGGCMQLGLGRAAWESESDPGGWPVSLCSGAGAREQAGSEVSTFSAPDHAAAG